MGIRHFVGIQRKIRFTALMLVVLVWGGVAKAADLGPNYSVEQLQANLYASQAYEVLRSGGDYETHQLELAKVFYDKALSFDPKNADLWRLRLELADKMRDTEMQIKAMRQIAKNDRKDDVNQLRLIRTLINSRQQTAEDRMAGIIAILKSKGGRLLSKPLRSRLASDVANYAYELGERAEVKKWLRVALAYDKTTNAAALGLVYKLAVDNGAPKQVIAKTFLDLMKSNISNPDYRKELAATLMRERAFTYAFEQVVAENYIRMGSPSSTEQEKLDATYRYAFTATIRNQFEGALRGINAWHKNMMTAAVNAEFQKVAEAAKAADQTPDYKSVDQKAVSESVKLQIKFEMMRIAILNMASQQAKCEELIKELTTRYEQEIDASPEKAEAFEMDLAWMVCFYSKEHEGLDALIKRVENHKTPNKGMIACLKGWALLAKDDLEGAKAWLKPYDNQLPFAKLGMAEIDKLNKKNEAYWAGLNAVIAMDPNGMSALAASHGLMRDKQEPQATPLGLAYGKMLEDLPTIVRMPTAVKGKKIAVRIDTTSKSYEFLEPNIAVVTIRNNLAIPMSLGGDDTALSNRLLIYVKLPTGGRPVSIVANVGRRLVLGAFESLELQVPLDWNTVGRAGVSFAGRMFEYSAECVYSPVIAPNGAPSAGPMGDRSILRLVAKQKILPTEPNIMTMVANLNSGDQLTQYRALAWLGRILPQMTLQEDLDPDDPKLAEKEKFYQSLEAAGKTYLETYNRLDANGKAWVAATLMVRPEGEASYLQGVYDAMLNNKEYFSNLNYLILQVRDPQHAAVNRALRSDDAELVKATGWAQKILEVRAENIEKIKAAQEAAKAAQTE